MNWQSLPTVRIRFVGHALMLTRYDGGRSGCNQRPQPSMQLFRSAKGIWVFCVAACALAMALAVSLRPSGTTPRSDTGNMPDEDPRLTFPTPYRNVRPDVHYVSDTACTECHAAQADYFQHHPMGRSLGPVSTVAASQHYEKAAHNPFEALGAQFLVDRAGERVMHRETRRDATSRVFA